VGAIPEGADGGIGLIRSYYATPIELALLPWSLDFTPDNAGNQPFPLEYVINPYQENKPDLEWRTEDWDPALRFWTLPYDRHLREWLRAAERSEPATLAALEFGGQPEKWHPAQPYSIDPLAFRWFEEADLDWQRVRGGFNTIKTELEQLKIYMEDDRERYLVEADVQADGLPAYLIHFLGINAFDHPWTLKLIDIGLALGNVAYMSYKAFYKRVRPSILMPGLTVPFGPPAHPAFPSGHSFLANLISLFLLEIPGIYYRYGVLPYDDPNAANPVRVNPGAGHLLRKPVWKDLNGDDPIPSPLLAIAQRIAVNRERIGVHYPSDSFGSRHLAAGIWDALLNRPLQNTPDDAVVRPIDCPTLNTVIEHAKSEWPTPW